MRLIVSCLVLLWPLNAARAQVPAPEPPSPDSTQTAPAPAAPASPEPATSSEPAPAPAPATAAEAPAPATPEPAATSKPAPAPATAKEAPAPAIPEPASEPAPAAAPATVAKAPPPRKTKGPKEAKFGGTFSVAPLAVRLPMVELTSEITLTSRNSLAFILGVGWPSVKVTPTNPFEAPYRVRIRAINVGGDYRYYMIGNFDRGVNLGTELMLMDYSGSTYAKTIGAWSILLGGKYAFPFGLTIDAQVGPALEFTANSQPAIKPWYNANIGWSFVFHRKAKRTSGLHSVTPDSDDEGTLSPDDDSDGD